MYTKKYTAMYTHGLHSHVGGWSVMTAARTRILFVGRRNIHDGVADMR